MDKEKLTAGTRVVLDMTTLTIMRALPREVFDLYILIINFNLLVCPKAGIISLYIMRE